MYQETRREDYELRIIPYRPGTNFGKEFTTRLILNRQRNNDIRNCYYEGSDCNNNDDDSDSDDSNDSNKDSDNDDDDVDDNNDDNGGDDGDD